jgi:hypothetical protein
MSGTSWAGTSTHYHVLTEVGAILKPPQKELDAIDRTTFTTCFLKDTAGNPLKLSRAKPHLRPLVLEQMLSQLARPRPDGSASPMQAGLAAIDDDNRRRLLLLTGSYDEARRAADCLETIERWAGKVCRLVSDDAEQDHLWREAAHVPSAPSGGPGALRRGDVATFAETGAEVLVAPLLAIERGHNILNDEGTAAIGPVFFLARPHPRPDDIGLAIQAVNDWAARMLRDGTFKELVNEADSLDAAGKEFRHQARAKWRHLLNRTRRTGRWACRTAAEPVPYEGRTARPSAASVEDVRRGGVAPPAHGDEDEMSPEPDERERIRAAMDRILARVPERSNGALTVVALAIEAGVPRNALTQRHTDLKNEFYQRIKEHGEGNEDEARLRATIARLRKTIEAKNRELAQLRADVPALVRAVSQLTLENHQLRDMRSGTGGSVVPFPGRQPARSRD